MSPYEDFLSTLADFIISKFPCNRSLPNLKVILPTGKDCLVLQQILTQKLNNTFLPTIISILELSTEGEEAFKIPIEKVDSISYLEYKILLSNIIKKFSKLKLNTFQSLECSASLINLFDEFNYNYISIESLSNLFTAECAEHWQLIYEFLYYAHYEIVDALKLINTSQHSIYHIRMLEAEIERLSNIQESYVIVAGIMGQNAVTWNFLKNIALSERGFIILPPIPRFSDVTIKACNNQVHSPLYCLGQLLDILNRQLSDFKILPNSNSFIQSSAFDGLLLNENHITKQNSYDDKIEYFEFDNIFQEAEKISQFCTKEKQAKIAIIITNENLKESYISFLNKYELNFQDECGISLLDTDIFQLVMNISKILCTEFCLSDLFILLKNPILHCDNVLLIENLLSSTKKFTASLTEISALVFTIEDEQLKNWWSLIANSLLIDEIEHIKSARFDMLLKKVIVATENICSHIWQRNHGLKISQFFAEIMRCRINFFVDDVEDFPEMLKNLVLGAKLHNVRPDECNIVICHPKDAVLTKYDVVILADFSEGSWPRSASANPWLNRKAQEDLGCNANQVKRSAALYNFYLLLHNPRVIITRSIKQANNVTTRSSFVMKLMHISPSAIITKSNHKSHFIDNKYYLSNNTNITSSHFPAIISATDIEVLIRNPYNFYLKKILQLRKLENIILQPQLSHFGNFIHKAIEKYTQDYDPQWQDKRASFIEIGNYLLKELKLPLHTQKIWLAKFEAIAAEFIKFDSSRRFNSTSIYSEIKGRLKIRIIDQDIEIVSIADRIEVDKYNVGTILDFKTGAIPSNIEVLSGLSPQLIIEAITLIEGGFDINCDLGKLIYVKISSSEPYIKIIEISLSKQELNKHKRGLEKLLAHYIQNKNFQKNIDCLKYNDYKHLARIE